jgi:hypothetical protein
MADRKPNALAVPRSAVVDVGGRRGVYLVDDDVARFQVVQTGLLDGGYIEIVDGLQDDVRLVTVGALALRDGDRITIAGANAREGGAGGRDSGGRAGGRRGAAGAPPSSTQ